jgi:hypothetical protein
MRTSLLAVTLCLMAPLASAAQTQITYLPAGVPPVTVTGDGKTPVSASVGVTLHPTSEVTLVFEPHVMHGPGFDLGLANQTGPGPVKYAANQYVTALVSILGLTRFGTYNGSVEFRQPQDAPGGKNQVPITVVVKGAVTIDTPALTAFRCLVPWSCAVGNHLAPPNQRIVINNLGGQESAQISRLKIMLRSAVGDSTLDEQQVKIDVSQAIPAGEVRALKVCIPSDKVVAGHYDGFAQVGFQSGDVISLPVTLDVRAAPLLAILLLVLGIVFGRVLQAVNSPTAQAQQRLIANIAALRSAAASIHDPNVALLLEKKMADARQAIATMNAGEPAITQQIQDIGTAITIESNLEWIEANLQQIAAPAQAAVQADVDTSRTALLSDDLAGADTARKKAQGDLLTHLSAAGPLPGKMSAQSMQFNAILPAAPTRRLYARVASLVAGTPAHLPVGKHAFFKDLMFIALLAGLVIVGLYTFYIKNAIFGANFLFDYFGIAVWGLSADVAQRTLQGLQLPK